jgi:hypothetical protein
LKYHGFSSDRSALEIKEYEEFYTGKEPAKQSQYIMVTAKCDTETMQIGDEKLHMIITYFAYIDDTVPLDDIIYAIAYYQNVQKNNNLSCSIHQNNTGFALYERNGSEYVYVDVQSEVEAIKTFTETITTIEYRNETTEGCIDARYSYVAYGEIQYEKGMTWEEWINSSYNTISPDVSIKTKDYDDVSLTEVIDSNKEYGFVMTSVKGKWQFLSNPNVTLGAYQDSFIEEVVYSDGKGRQFSSMWLTGSDIGYCAGFFPMTVYKPANGWIDQCDIIDFGDTLQQVTPEFYEWLTANATMIE